MRQCNAIIHLCSIVHVSMIIVQSNLVKSRMSNVDWELLTHSSASKIASSVSINTDGLFILYYARLW